MSYLRRAQGATSRPTPHGGLVIRYAINAFRWNLFTWHISALSNFLLFQLFQSECPVLAGSRMELHFVFAAATSSRRLRPELGTSGRLQREGERTGLGDRGDSWSCGCWRVEGRGWGCLGGKRPDLRHESGRRESVQRLQVCKPVVPPVEKHICRVSWGHMTELWLTIDSRQTDEVLQFHMSPLARWQQNRKKTR